MKKGLRKVPLILSVIITLCLVSNSVLVSGSSYAFDMNQLGIMAGMKP